MQYYGGICVPDLVSIWRRHTEQQLESMERAELTRPPKPRDPAIAQAVYRNPHPGPVVIARGEIISNRVESPAPPKAAEATPAPAPAPKREPRRDGPPDPGQKQVHS